MLRKFLPKEDRFFEYFEQQTQVIGRGLELFAEMLQDYPNRKEYCARIKEVENQADQIVHNIFQLLNNTFVTPFDREDIKRLVHRLDDVLDYAEDASARMDIYDIPDVPEPVRALVDILREAFKSLSQAMLTLRNLKQRQECDRFCIEVNRLENTGDGVLREALRKLFKEETNPIMIIKLREIYESLEEAIDRCEDVANTIETILIKNA
ncbi:MAG: DUF47 domain-containing protein [Thermodesulfobacteriota bacterium]